MLRRTVLLAVTASLDCVSVVSQISVQDTINQSVALMVLCILVTVSYIGQPASRVFTSD